MDEHARTRRRYYRPFHRPNDYAIYVRAGAIIPFDPIRQYTSQPVTQPTTLRVYPCSDGDFTLYDDDGSSQQYLQGKATWIHLLWNDHTRTLALESNAPAGLVSQPVHRKFIVQIMKAPVADGRTITYDGKRMMVKM